MRESDEERQRKRQLQDLRVLGDSPVNFCVHSRQRTPLHGCLSKHFKWKCTWHFRRCNHWVCLNLTRFSPKCLYVTPSLPLMSSSDDFSPVQCSSPVLFIFSLSLATHSFPVWITWVLAAFYGLLVLFLILVQFWVVEVSEDVRIFTGRCKKVASWLAKCCYFRVHIFHHDVIKYLYCMLKYVVTRKSANNGHALNALKYGRGSYLNLPLCVKILSTFAP